MTPPSPSLRCHRVQSPTLIFLMLVHTPSPGSESDSRGWVRPRRGGWLAFQGQDVGSAEAIPGRHREVGLCLGSKSLHMLIVPLDFLIKQKPKDESLRTLRWQPQSTQLHAQGLSEWRCALHGSHGHEAPHSIGSGEE